MIIFFLVFVLCCLYKFNIKKCVSGFSEDYMSVEKTTCIKGIFIVIVFFSHFLTYVKLSSPSDMAFNSVFSHIGQRMVAMFMFYSGYGIAESVRKKGMSYVYKMPKNRLLRVLAEFDFAVIIFLAVQLALGKHYTWKKILLSFVAWDAVGNSNWYIFAVLVMYALTFVSFMIFGAKEKPSYILCTALTVIFITAFAVTKVKEPYWYNTMICYIFGMWFSLLRPYTEKHLMKSTSVYFTFFFIIGALTVITLKFADRNLIFYEINMLLFTAFVLIMTMRFTFCNRILLFLGKNLFPIYILQRLPMLVFSHFGLNEYNIYIYFVVCFAVTAALAPLFNKAALFITKPLTAKKSGNI